MSLIIETDLGHDPDDLFTILWLLAADVDIGAVVVTPGDPDQLAIAQLIRDETGARFAIGASRLGRTKLSSGSVHHALLKRYGYSLEGHTTVLGVDAIHEARQGPDDLLAIGPLTNVGAYLGIPTARPFKRATMQGGFVPYSLYQPLVVLDAFLGKDWMPTFNLNGDRKAAEHFLAAPFPRQMVGKNVCHTVVLEPQHQMERFEKAPNRAAELFMEAAHLLRGPKRFHDPVAAVCHLHPEVGVWIDGKTVKRAEGWTTIPGDDRVLVDLNRDAFWARIYSWNRSS